MSVLEWLLIIEAVCLLTGGIFWVTGFAIGRDDPDDPFTAFYQTFWKVFLRKRGRLRSAVTALDVEKARKYDEMKQTGDVEGIKELLENEFGGHAFDESEISAALDESIAAPPAPPGRRRRTRRERAPRRSRSRSFRSRKRTSSSACAATASPSRSPAARRKARPTKPSSTWSPKALNIKPYQVTLMKGHYKPFKTVQIAGYDQRELDLKMASYS